MPKDDQVNNADNTIVDKISEEEDNLSKSNFENRSGTL